MLDLQVWKYAYILRPHSTVHSINYNEDYIPVSTSICTCVQYLSTHSAIHTDYYTENEYIVEEEEKRKCKDLTSSWKADEVSLLQQMNRKLEYLKWKKKQNKNQ